MTSTPGGIFGEAKGIVGADIRPCAGNVPGADEKGIIRLIGKEPMED